MDTSTQREILRLFSELGVDTQNDADLARGYLMLLLENGIAESDEKLHVYINNNMFADSLEDDQVELFEASDNAGEDVSQNINKLTGIFESEKLYDFRSFFSSISPWIVADWDAYLSNFNKHQTDVFKCAALAFLLKCQEAYAPGSAVFAYPVGLYKSRPEIALHWNGNLGLREEHFAACWNAVFFYRLSSIPTKINGNISKAIRKYRKFYVPMSKLLTDYYDVNKYGEFLERQEHVVDPWMYINKGIKKIPVESGMTVAETVFETAAFYLKEEHATNIIRAVFYPKSRNDSGFEYSFLLEQFSGILSDKTNVLVVNPSPDLILQWKADVRFSACHTYFAVPDETVAACYSHEFKEFHFLPFSDISKLDAIERVLTISRDYPIIKLDELLTSLSVCSDTAQILAVLPNAYIDSAGESFEVKLKDNDCLINRILLITPAATNSIPRKKVLLHLEKVKGTIQQTNIPLYTSLCDKTGQQFHIRKEHWDISRNELFVSNRTILSLQKKVEYEKKNPSGEINRRNPAERYDFSREISVFYTIQENRKNRYAGKAYYCETLISGANNRRHGKRLTEIIEKGLRAKTKSELLAKLQGIPFDPRVDPYIVHDVCSAYADKLDTLSLKTVWFICRRNLLKSGKYDEGVAKRLFCGAYQELSDVIPSFAWYDDYIQAMEHLFECEPQEIQLRYWQQLSLILETAVRERFIRFNSVAAIVRKLSSQLTEEQREVRNALVKKTFTMDEERKMLEFICARVKGADGSATARRFEVESIWLIGAIRLFTGMSVREICALQWSDFVRIPNMKAYQFLVTKAVSDDGKITADPNKENWKKYRRVPIVPALAEMLSARMDYLTTVRKIPAEHLKDAPIILNKEKAGDSKKGTSTIYCRPRAANECCKKIIEAAEIPEQLLLLPDDDNQTVTDINRYTGDIFQSNFKYRANHTCGLTQGEINYMLGHEPLDTFSRHYCDFANDFVQYDMLQRLQRWTAEHPALGNCIAHSRTITAIVKGRSTDVFGPYGTGAASVDMIIEPVNQSDETLLDIGVDCDFGFTGDVVVYST